MTEEEKIINQKEVATFVIEIRELKNKLFKAIETEEYELAAQLHNKIKNIQSELVSFLSTLKN